MRGEAFFATGLGTSFGFFDPTARRLGYRSTDGMGLLEFLLWCDDMGAEPVLAVYAGYRTALKPPAAVAETAKP